MILLNAAVQYSTQHHYTLQPQKSVIIPINQKRKCSEDVTFKLSNENMSITDKSVKYNDAAYYTGLLHSIESVGHIYRP
jgi:hypothetical protein